MSRKSHRARRWLSAALESMGWAKSQASARERLGRRSLAMEPLESRTLLTATFANAFTLGLPGLNECAMAAANSNAYGYVDLLLTGDLTGNPITRLYEFNGSQFSQVNSGFLGVSNGAVAWGDLDNDNDPDLLLTGTLASGDPVAKIYTNSGGNGFVVSSVTLADVTGGSVAWGDYDNDGLQDILLTGADSAGQATTKLYHNDGQGQFSDSGASLADVANSSVAFGDYDNDGLLDILLTGTNASNLPLTMLYHNDGGGQFSDSGASLVDVDDSAVSMGDYDNDGRLDILLTGLDSAGDPVAAVYHNNGGGQFADVVAGLPGVFGGSAAWGDCDGDGRLDILLAGDTGDGTIITKVYGNSGGGVFTDSGAMSGHDASVAVLCNYDDVGGMDVLSMSSTSTATATAYRNTTSNTWAKPDAPTGLTATKVSGGVVTLSWTAPTDNTTPSSGLSYVLRVGSATDGTDIVSPVANATIGTRYVFERGAIQGTSWTIDVSTLPPQIYHWSVQAVDTTLVGSTFAAEGTFSTVPPGPPEITVLNGSTNIKSGQTTAIDLGSAAKGSTGPSKTFTIRNDGESPLTLTTPLASTTHFTVSDPGSSVVAPNESTTFTVTLDTGAIWSGSEQILVYSDDGDNGNGDGIENPFTFHVSGSVTAVGPEIAILCDGNVLTSGDTTAINIGSAFRGANGPSKTFTIRNVGTQPLTLSNVPFDNPFHFEISAPSTTTIAPGGATTFTVTLITGEIWNGEEVFYIVNDDADNDDGVESPFTITVAGEVTDMPAEVSVSETLTSNPIISGSTTISFGAVTQGDAAPQKTFTIKNVGDKALLLTSTIASTAHFTVTQPLASTLVANASTTFTITLNTGVAWTDLKSEAISFSSNDGLGDGVDEDPFVFYVTGVVNPLGPEIVVLDGTTNVADGQATPIVIGSAARGSTGPSRTFTIRNDGQQALTLSAFLLPAHFTASQPGKTTLATGETTTFTVTLKTTTLWAGGSEQISFTTNDAANEDGIENPFNFTVSGSVTAMAPEIVVLDGSTNIADDQAAPVDIGMVPRRGIGPSKTFTIRNIGDQTLTLGSPVTNGTHFHVGELDKTSLGYNETATFTVTLLTDEVWTGTEQISFTNNDALTSPGDTVENPFSFLISGTVDATWMMFDDISLPEGNSGTTSFKFNVNLLVPSADWVTVNYAVVGDTATADVDFIASSGVLKFAPGQTVSSIRVAVIGDKVFEDNETFKLILTDPATSEVITEGQGTIRDDDAPKVSINDAKVREGAAGETMATFTVTLSAKSVRDATVFYSTADGTATAADNDYQSVDGLSVTIPAGQTKQTFTVFINGDTKYEANETFKVNLTDAIGALISRGTATATITNDDTVPSATIGNATLVTDGTFTRAEFVVSLAAPSGLPAKVKFATANGTARSGKDYQGFSGWVQFAAGETQKTVSVLLLGDPSLKIGKTFYGKISSPTGAKIGKPNKGLCTIQVVSPAPSAILDALAVASKPAARSNTVKIGPVVDEAIRLLMLTSK